MDGRSLGHGTKACRLKAPGKRQFSGWVTPPASVSSRPFVPGPHAMLGTWLISLLKLRTALLRPTRESRRDTTSMLKVGSWSVWDGKGKRLKFSPCGWLSVVDEDQAIAHKHQGVEMV